MPFTVLRIVILLALVGAILMQYLNAGLALLCGLVFALVLGNPIRARTQKWAGLLLKTSVVGLGFGLNLQTLWTTTQQGIGLTIGTIVLALAFGLLLGKLLKVDADLSTLICTGTAICGGSAIAAMAPTIRAKPEQTTIAVSIVFILNGIALYLFPWVGGMLELTQQQFGLWAALGIHDTSSVVGAASQYGEVALSIATATKLARALWIIPLVLIASWYTAKKQKEASKAKVKLPYFILLFVLASAITTFVPVAASVAPTVVMLAKSALITSLLLMGAGFTKAIAKSLDLKPMIQAVILWVSISTGSLLAILYL
jgi:uncharacterized integral membrane protein (TIGR00698 family)